MFNERLEQTQQQNFVELDKDRQILSIHPIDPNLVGKSFAVYINGHVAVNSTVNIEPVSQHNKEQYFDISIVAINTWNTPP